VSLTLPGGSLPALAPWLPAALAQNADKLVHLGLFLVLVLLVFRSIRRWMGATRSVTYAVIATLVYMLILESAQLWIPGRGWERGDLAAGAAGVALGGGLLALCRRRGPPAS